MGLSLRCLTPKWFLVCWWCTFSIHAGPYTASFKPNPVTVPKETAAFHLISPLNLDCRWATLLYSYITVINTWDEMIVMTVCNVRMCYLKSKAERLLHPGSQWWVWTQPSVQSWQIWHQPQVWKASWYLFVVWICHGSFEYSFVWMICTVQYYTALHSKISNHFKVSKITLFIKFDLV